MGLVHCYAALLHWFQKCYKSKEYHSHSRLNREEKKTQRTEAHSAKVLERKKGKEEVRDKKTEGNEAIHGGFVFQKNREKEEEEESERKERKMEEESLVQS